MKPATSLLHEGPITATLLKLAVPNVVVMVVQASLGLLLGVGVLKTFIKDPTAQAKMDQTIAKLAPKQGMLGLIAIGLGIWLVVADLLIW